ncbi:phospholipid scramblase 1 [Entomortierella beljakovae]|nr:phospholipid scramblase 1 [Entomortierella beljakovae]
MASLRKQQTYFFILLFVYILTGAGALILGNIWLGQSENGAPRDAVISREIEHAGTVIGGIVVGTSIFGIVGGMYPIQRKSFLLLFVILLLSVMLAELGLGGIIWFKTLRMRSLYQIQWETWTDSLKIAFQEMTSLTGYEKCCGYLQGQSVVASGFCANPPVDTPGCEEKISAFADGYLRKLFTSLFGFTIVNVICFVATVILIQTRNDEERYIRIRRKEGRAYKNVI